MKDQTRCRFDIELVLYRNIHNESLDRLSFPDIVVSTIGPSDWTSVSDSQNHGYNLCHCILRGMVSGISALDSVQVRADLENANRFTNTKAEDVARQALME